MIAHLSFNTCADDKPKDAMRLIESLPVKESFTLGVWDCMVLAECGYLSEWDDPDDRTFYPEHGGFVYTNHTGATITVVK